jgi:predicted NAD/FAD-binding protein
MSFSYESPGADLAYAGTGLNGLFAQRRNLARPSFYRLLREIVRFSRAAMSDLEQGAVGERTMDAYLTDLGCSEQAIRQYIYPMAAAIWSAPQQDIGAFPAATLLHFWRNHGLLSTQDRPRWQTVVGGSCAYVHAFREGFNGTIQTGVKLSSIQRKENEVILHHEDGSEETFAGVVIATHADEALALLADPTDQERGLLGAWRYQANDTILHTDTSFLPRNRRAWASWNYVEPEGLQPDQPVPVTYNMNILQGLDTRETYCVTLNPTRPIQADRIVRSLSYTHPIFSREAIATQDQLPELNGVRRTWFCGSYFGYGFHEDAVRSGFRVAEALGMSKV